MLGQLRPGDRLDRYSITGVLGTGAMGVVYAAHDMHLSRKVALKVMADHLAADPEFRTRFTTEATLLARLDSPHVVHVFDHGESEGSPWLATQLVAGGDLGTRLAEHGALPPATAIVVLEQVSAALSAAHSVGVLHRDVKASNVLIDNLPLDLPLDSGSDHTPRTYLCDFGIAQVATEVTDNDLSTGWHHLAPELGQGAPASPASDIYAAGCLLWTALTGRPVFPGVGLEVALAHQQQPPPTLPGKSPAIDHLNTVLATALAKDPTQRYADATAFGQALRATPQPGLAPIRMSNRARAPLAVAAVLALALGLGGLYFGLVRGEEPAGSATGSASPNPSASPAPSATAVPEPVEGPITGDLDGDGFGDVAVNERGKPKELTRIWSSQQSRFAPPDTWGGGANTLRGDTTGDGVADLVAISQGPGRFASSLSVYVVPGGNPRGTVREHVVKTPSFLALVQATLGDFNGDGRDDIAVVRLSGQGSTVLVALSQGTGFAAFRPWFTHPSSELTIKAGDFDGDGMGDLIWARSQQLHLFTSTGSRFQAKPASQIAVSTVFGHPGDFDGDGAQEWAALVDDQVIVAKYDGAGWTTAQWGSVPTTLGTDVNTVGDFNGDGRDDLFHFDGEYASGDFDMQVLLSTGRSFAAPASWGHYTCGCRGEFQAVGNSL